MVERSRCLGDETENCGVMVERGTRGWKRFSGGTWTTPPKSEAEDAGANSTQTNVNPQTAISNHHHRFSPHEKKNWTRRRPPASRILSSIPHPSRERRRSIRFDQTLLKILSWCGKPRLFGSLENQPASSFVPSLIPAFVDRKKTAIRVIAHHE